MSVKVGPISGDLVVKLGLGVFAFGGLAMLIYTYKSNLSAAAGAAAQKLDPTNPDNLVNSTVNTWGGNMVTDPTGPGKNADGSWTLGGWLHDVLNPGTYQAVNDISKPTIFPPNPYVRKTVEPDGFTVTYMDANGNIHTAT